ncbi:MAG: DNA-processing protein DprA [Acidobacteria bacterium]|nr:DNA-processing protein DprA [Acidobacteriota bacterium]
MASLREIVAVSLLWTETPRVPAGASAVCDLDQALDVAGIGRLGGVRERLLDRAEIALAEGAAHGLQALVRGGECYPASLALIPDPPAVLWIRGDLRPTDLAVAIVGSRTATPLSLDVGFQLGEGLARAGLAVVSGMARGVDSAAHRGALQAGGRTIAVLGCGADVVYPPEHAALADRISRSGALVSELPPGAPPLAWHFPRRNRIISGLSLGVVVVEAAADSGSLITARCALDQNRPVMAVPGGVLSGRNRGAHALIKDGARVVEGVSDVLEELRLEILTAADPEARLSHPSNDPLLRVMDVGEPYLLETLCAETGLDPARALSRLAELELAGWICRAGGGRFVKPGSNVLR